MLILRIRSPRWVASAVFVLAVFAGSFVADAVEPEPLMASFCEMDICINIPYPDGDEGHCIDFSALGVRSGCDEQADGSCRRYSCDGLQ